MQSKMNRKGFWLLLTLAVLIVAASVLVAVAISADQEPAEFTEFGYQTLSNLDLPNDEDTALRFYFKINNLDYTEVGFVLSKTNSTPTIGGANCYKAGTDTVYSTINAGGEPMVAGEGHYWVAVKMTNIPRSYFDGPIYVSAFVIDGEGTRYSDPESITVCVAAGHETHTVSLQYSGTASMTNAGTKIGYCSECNLDNVTQYDVQNTSEGKMWTSGGGSDSWVDSRQISTVLAGGKHFYPDASNDYEGNDLIVEYSVLWNETLLNMMPRNTVDNDHKYDAVVLSAFSTSQYGYSNYKSIGYWGLSDNVPGSGAQIAGAFEYPNPMIQTNEVGTPYPGMSADGGIYSDYPNIGGTVIKNPEWGWHRIGIIYHEDVTNLAAVESSGADAEYKLTITLYIDGQVVSILSGTDLYYENNEKTVYADYKLFTVEKVGEELIYTDIDSDYYIYTFGIRSTKANTTGTDVYFVDGDAFVNAGHGFVQNVKRIDNPKSRSETVTTGDNFGSTNFAIAPFYYTTGDFCVSHTWDETYTPGKAATLLGKGTKIDHCSVCGIARESVNNETSATVLSDTWTTSSTGSFPASSSDTSSPLTFNIKTDILDGGKNAFYPTAGNPGGNDLLVEYSFLWNPTLLNLDPGNEDASGAPYIGTGIHKNSALDELNNIVYWSPTANMPYSGCQSAGGIEYASLTTSEPGNPYPNMIKNNQGIEKYPNIGGNNDGDGQTQAQDQYGWHRVQIRLHQEVTNLAALKASKSKNSPAATYKLTGYIYIDGALVSVLSDDMTKWKSNNLLFTANADGKGGVTYGTVRSDRILNAVRANLTTAASDSVYFSVADVYATCGHDFVQQVQRVQYPDGGTEDHYSHRLYYASAEASVESVERLTDSSSGSFGVKKNIVYEVLKGRHFYPTEDNPDGNDLYVEYSVNWKADLINNVMADDTYRPFIDSRISAIDGTSTMNNFTFWTLTANNKSAACKYAGGFEYTDAIKVSETGNPYPNMIKDSQAITKYPNIGGANNGDGQSQVNNKYGWHRIGMQLHQEVTNLDTVKTNGDTAQYKLTCRLYIDGKLVSIMSDYPGKWDSSNLLYTAASDGNGGVTYTDIGADRWLYIFRLNSTRTKSGETVDFEYKDCYATAGHSFVQPVDQHTHDFLTTNTGRHICAVCGANSNDAVKTNAYQKIFTSDNTASYGDRKLLSAIMGSKHFYPTNETPTGNDLLIEYSFLWNPTLSNFGAGTEGSDSPFVTTRFSNWSGTNENVLSYWSLRDNCKDAWCKYAGGFEAGALQTVASDDIVAGGTPSGMCASGGNYAAYPNIGGSIPADLANLYNGHQWGWHRVQIRLHQEVTNVDAVKDGAAAEYRFVCTTYFDGVAVSTLEKTGTHLGQKDGRNYLFSAASDGEGGITYSDNAYLTGSDSVKRTIWAFKFNYTPTAGDNAYWEEADIFYTCGHDFVQDVEKVASPAYVDYEIASGIHVNGATYYRVID